MNIDFNGNMSFLVSGKNVDNNKLLKMGDTEVCSSIIGFVFLTAVWQRLFGGGYVQYYYEYAKK